MPTAQFTHAFTVNNSTYAAGKGYLRQYALETLYFCPRHAAWITEGTQVQPDSQQQFPNLAATRCWACHTLETTHVQSAQPQAV